MGKARIYMKHPIICIIGMHRSGTSAMSRCLNLLGAFIPGPMIPAAPDNERGFWEPAHLVGLHDQALRDVGTTFHGYMPVTDPVPRGTEE